MLRSAGLSKLWSKTLNNTIAIDSNQDGMRSEIAQNIEAKSNMLTDGAYMAFGGKRTDLDAMLSKYSTQKDVAVSVQCRVRGGDGSRRGPSDVRPFGGPDAVDASRIGAGAGALQRAQEDARQEDCDSRRWRRYHRRRQEGSDEGYRAEEVCEHPGLRTFPGRGIEPCRIILVGTILHASNFSRHANTIGTLRTVSAMRRWPKFAQRAMLRSR